MSTITHSRDIYVSFKYKLRHCTLHLRESSPADLSRVEDDGDKSIGSIGARCGADARVNYRACFGADPKLEMAGETHTRACACARCSYEHLVWICDHCE